MSTWGYEWWAAYEGERLTLREWLQRVPPDPERLNLEKCAPLFIEEVYLRRSYFVDALGIPKVKHPGGRPSRYSRELAIDICCRWANTGGAWLKALDSFKIDKTTALRWRRRHKEFYMMFRFIQDLLRHYPDRFPPRRYRRRRVVMNPEYARNSSSIRRERRRGRPSTYHPDFIFKVWPSQRQTARAIGVSKGTVAKWCKRYKEFGDVQKACWILKCRF